MELSFYESRSLSFIKRDPDERYTLAMLEMREAYALSAGLSGAAVFQSTPSFLRLASVHNAQHFTRAKLSQPSLNLCDGNEELLSLKRVVGCSLKHRYAAMTTAKRGWHSPAVP